MRSLSPPLARALRPFALLALLVAGLLGPGCAQLIEPQPDPTIAAGLETLATDTRTLFDAIAADPQGGAARAPVYAALVRQATDLRLRATLREIQVETSDRYGVATAGFLDDYLGNLTLLEQRDEAGPPPPAFVTLRRAAITDTLRDALFYERTVLDRIR